MDPVGTIPVIALTGGPCAGKTTVLTHLSWELAEHGVNAVVVPEAARMLIAGGLIPDRIGIEAFQEAIIRTQRVHEDTFLKYAANLAGKTVLLCDRGCMDGKAYVSPQAFARTLEKVGETEVSLRDERYEAVIHLVTAALGAEEFYQGDNERLESIEEARVLDERTQHAWVGHPHLRVIDNQGSFDDKKHRALKTVLHQLGMPAPLEIERKFKADRSILSKLPPHARRLEIEQYYLKAENNVPGRIRKRGEQGSYTYYLTMKRPVRSGVREEIERRISAEEYYQLRKARGMKVLQKHRWCFLYEGQYIEVDDFSSMDKDLVLVEVELTDENEQVVLPGWMGKCDDVTDDPMFSNVEIAIDDAFGIMN